MRLTVTVPSLNIPEWRCGIIIYPGIDLIFNGFFLDFD
jgi:hypothetical protein